jgi:hypothetical protein
METGFDSRSRRNLEQYLQDLVCEATSMAEVGVLVEVLMELQQRAPMSEPANNRATGAAAGE